jgi:hypothetical protein
MEEKYKDMAKVVTKIDDYQFVINRGSEHGVKIGANYLIFRLGDRLEDPDTGEDLGVLEIVRGRARVTHVQERLATLKSSEMTFTPGTKRTIKRQGGGLGGLTAFLNVPSEEEIEEGRESHLSVINVTRGDIARPI